MKKSILMILTLVLSTTVFLSACEDSDKGSKKPSSDASKNNTYDLVYYEVLNNGDAEDASKVKHYHPSLDHVYEHIIDDGDEKPHVVKDGKKFFIYRPPYMTYGDDDFSGKVEDKSDVKK